MLEFKKEYFQTETNRHLYPTTLDLSKAEVYGCKDREAYMYKIPNNRYTSNAGNIDFSLYPNGVWSDYTGIKIVERLPFFQPSINFNKLGDITPSNLNKLKEEIKKHIVDLETAITESVNFIDSGVPGQNNLPYLPEGCVWFRDPIIKDVIALPISELYGKFNQMIDELRKILLKLLDKDYNDTLLKFLENVKKELERQLSILAGAGSAFKPKQVANIEILKNVNAKVDEVYEVLGYYRFDDGATHKRVIANEDDGSGVQLTNGLWANIVHNGEVNVSWFGAKGDGVTDDTLAIQKAIDNANVINFQEKTYIVSIQSKDKDKYCLIINKNNKKLNLNFGKLKLNNPDNYTTYMIIKILNSSNIFIIDGVLLGDKDTNPNTTVTQGHGMCIENSNNIYIFNTKFIKMYADGIKIYTRDFNNISSGIVIENCIIDNVRRNGITVSTAHNVLINNCKISNAKGALPEAGIDLEPGYSEHPNENIKITNCTISDCNTQGIVNGNSGKGIFISKNYLKNNNLNIIYCEDVSVQENILVNCKSIAIRGATNVNVHSNELIDTECNIVGNNKNNRINRNLRIANNSFNFSDGNQLNALKITNTTLEDTEDIIFENNIIKNPENAFIYVYSRVKNIYIKNNTFFSNKIDGYIFLIRSDNSELVNNDIFIGSFTENLSSTFSINSNEQLIENNTFIIKQIPKFILFSLNFLDVGRRIDVDNNILKSEHDIKIIARKPEGTFLSVTYNDFRNSSSLGIVPDYEVGNRLKVNAQAQIQQLNSIYHLEKMKQENVYDDYITYNDEKFAYDKQQEKFEKEKQLAYKEVLKENPNLTYEEFMSVQPMILNLVEEPQPSQALKQFMEKYL